MAEPDLRQLAVIAAAVARSFFTDSGDVEELAQCALAAYAVAEKRVREPDAWIKQVTWYLAAHEVKRRQLERRLVERLGVRSSGTYEAFSDEVTLKVMLRSVIDQLTPRQRTAVHLYYIEDYPRKLVADVMGVSEETIKTLLKRARKTMRRLLTSIQEGGADD